MKLILESLQTEPLEVEINEEDTVTKLLNKVPLKKNLEAFLLIDGNIISSDMTISDLPKYDSYLVLHRKQEEISQDLEDTIISPPLTSQEYEGVGNLTSTYQTLLGSLPNNEGNPIIQEIQNILSGYSNINTLANPQNAATATDSAVAANSLPPLPPINNFNTEVYNNLVQQIGNIMQNSNIPLNTIQPISNSTNYAPFNNDILPDSPLAPVNQPISNTLNNIFGNIPASPANISGVSFPGNNNSINSTSDEDSPSEEHSPSETIPPPPSSELETPTIVPIPTNIPQPPLPNTSVLFQNLFNFQNILPPTAPVADISSHSETDLDQLRVTYSSQLESMQAMGFQQDETNLQALIINNGNLENSVNWILNLN